MMSLVISLLLASSTAEAAAVEKAQHAPTPTPLRVLIVGDSVTHGSAGDWTWRYRLWQHLTTDGAAVDFVGPRDDLWDNVAAGAGSQDYLDLAFDRDHASRWGATLSFFGETDYRVDELVETYAPDVVIEMLGVNDLTFLAQTPVEVAGHVREFVHTAREGDPEVDIVLGRLTQRWYDGVAEFNTLVDGVASELDSNTSRVTVAATDADFNLREDTWDPAHPNARGELKIAAAMADALAVLDLAQPYPRPLPKVQRGPREAAVLTAVTENRRATMTWTGPPGADQQVVWVRDVTASADARALPDPVQGTSKTLRRLTRGHTYDLWLQPVKGYWTAAADVRSNVVRVTIMPALPGRVRLSRVTSPRRDRVRVVAGAVAGATTYRVDLAPARSCSKTSVRFTRRITVTRPRATVKASAPFVRVRVAGRNAAGLGPFSKTSRCLPVR